MAQCYPVAIAPGTDSIAGSAPGRNRGLVLTSTPDLKKISRPTSC